MLINTGVVDLRTVLYSLGDIFGAVCASVL